MRDLKEFGDRYARAWSSQNPDNLAACYSAAGSLRVNDDAPAVGRQAIAELARGFMTALPDMKVVADDLVLDGERVLFHWTLTGTNSGPGGTGHRVRISGYEEWRLDSDGLIAESRGHMDTAEYQRQLQQGVDDSHASGE